MIHLFLKVHVQNTHPAYRVGLAPRLMPASRTYPRVFIFCGYHRGGAGVYRQNGYERHGSVRGACLQGPLFRSVLDPVFSLRSVPFTTVDDDDLQAGGSQHRRGERGVLPRHDLPEAVRQLYTPQGACRIPRGQRVEVLKFGPWLGRPGNAV